MSGNEDFFNLAQLEQPQMMPSAPLGGGALAGMMYGQDKARQDNAFQGALGLAQMRAQHEAALDKEFDAGAPGRLATIDYNNQLAQAKVGTAPDAITTQANTAKTQAIQSEITKLAPYAMSYDPTDMNDDDKRAFIDNMKEHGITKIGNKNLDDIKNSDDELDNFDQFMSHAKQAAVNTPGFAQKMALTQEQGKNWVQRYAQMGQNWVDRETIRQEGADRRANAKITAQQASDAAKAGRLNMGQYKAQLYQRAEQGDENAKEVLYQIQTQELATAVAKAQNSPDQYDTSKGDMRPPAVPKPAPFPALGGKPAPSPQPSGGNDQVPPGMVDAGEKAQRVDASTLKVGDKSVKAAYDPNGNAAYKGDDGKWHFIRKANIQ